MDLDKHIILHLASQTAYLIHLEYLQIVVTDI